MPNTLGLQPYLENAALEVAETFAVPLSYHNLATILRKVLISQMARRQSQSSVKTFGSSASTISTRFRVATEDIFVQRHILQLRSLRQQVRTAWSRQQSKSKFYLTMISRRTRTSIEAARETVDLLPLLPPSGYSNFLKNGTLDLSETSASQRKEYNPSTILSKVLNSQMAITSSSYNDD